VDFWINKERLERADLGTVVNPGREPDEGLAAVIAGKLDADPHLSARSRVIVHCLNIELIIS
jgi:hypothetical protein